MIPTILEELNTEIERIHTYAKEKGWWEKPRRDKTIYALFHSEISEAVEEERKPVIGAGKRDMYYFDDSGNPIHHLDIGDNWAGINPKPEGTGVELIDVVIRVLDYMGYKGREFPAVTNVNTDFVIDDLSFFTDLHATLVGAASFIGTNPIDESYYLGMAMMQIEAYFVKNGWDFMKIFMEKHNYNCTRSYRHGGKQF